MKVKFLFITLLIVALLLSYFYRFPTQKIITNNDNVVFSPAYGKVMSIKEIDDDKLFVAIFLSPLDIHYQFFPISGKLTNIQYDSNGKFKLAFELNKSNENEKAIYTIVNKNGEFKVFQIAGFLVRRISIFKNVGDNVETGQTMGLIHFGSRVDMIIPNRSKFKLQIKENDYLNGTNSVIGFY